MKLLEVKNLIKNNDEIEKTKITLELNKKTDKKIILK